MIAGTAKKPGSSMHMAPSRLEVTNQIHALKACAKDELRNHHPEVAVPLLEQALKLHKVLNGNTYPDQHLHEYDADDVDLLADNELDTISETANRTALALDEFDPFTEFAIAGNPAPGIVGNSQASDAIERPPSETFLDNETDQNESVLESKLGERTYLELVQQDAFAFCRASHDLFIDHFDESDSTDSTDIDAGIDDNLDEFDDPERDDLEDLALSHRPFFELALGLPEPDEFDETPTREEIEEVRTNSKLTHGERALQEAIRIGMQYDWDADDIQLLAEVFRLHWWSASKRSMVRELESGMRPHELRLALVVREAWRNNPEFHVNLSQGWGWHGYAHPNLTWPVALAIARHYDFEPDPDEVGVMLHELHDQWRSSAALADEFKSLYGFIRLHFGLDERYLNDVPGWSFVPNSDTRCIEDDSESLQQTDWIFRQGCFRTLPAPMLD